MLEREPTQRRTWKLGLVLLMYVGADGLVRKARIKTATSIIYNQPILKLCLIATKEELSNETQATTNVVINTYHCSIQSHNVIRFPHFIGSVLHEIIQV